MSQQNEILKSAQELLEAEEAFMRHCRAYAEANPSERFSFAEQVMRLWHSTRERRGFMADLEDKAIFLEDRRLINIMLSESRKRRADNLAARLVRLNKIARLEEDWEFESACCEKGPSCACHAVRPKFDHLI